MISHDARLITFLREVGVLDDAAMHDALGPAATTWAKGVASGRSLRGILAGQLAVSLALGLTVGGLELVRGRDQDPTLALGPRPMGTSGVGYLRVLARPWAEISVDGIPVDTTPTARPVPLAPGTHFVRLRNPSYITEDRSVQVTAGQVVWIDLDLRPASEGRRGE